MEIIIKAYFSFLVGMVIWIIIAIARTNNIFNNHIKIIDAIFEHNQVAITQREFNKIISYDCIETWEETERRFWDWSCKRMVPAEIYAEIYPYIYKDN